MYSGTRAVIDRQLAPMQIGIRKTDSTISISARPSMPSAQAMPSAGPTRSTNCHCSAADEASKPTQIATPSARFASVTASATQRATWAGENRHSPAPVNGSSSISDSTGTPLTAAPPR